MTIKLWKNIRKRIAKKRLGKRWSKLQFGRTLKPADLVSTCIGYNQRIREIRPEWRFGNRVVIDFDITTEDGSSHSLIHCCEGHIETKEEIIAYWLDHDRPGCKEWYESWSDGIKMGGFYIHENYHRY